MNTLRTTLLAGLAALSLGSAAYAQTQAQPQPQAQHPRAAHAPTADQRAQFEAKRAEFAAKRAARLHDELMITPAQEGAWKSFTASMKPPARPQRADRAAWEKLTAPQRMAKMIELQKQRTSFMEQRLGAVNSFYAVLTPEQKKVFDMKAARLQARMGEHGGRGGHDGHGRMGGWGHGPQRGGWEQHGEHGRG